MSMSAGRGNERVQVGLKAVLWLALTAALVLAFFFLVPESAYLWVKAAHIIAVISWMAGMLYLPRLFVYHAATPVGTPQSETFKVMERRLLKAIINPAMVATWVLGLWLALTIGAFEQGWFHGKFAAVLALSAVHGYLAGAQRKFAEDRNITSQRHWRIVNEVPTLLMIVIVLLAVVKPF